MAKVTVKRRDIWIVNLEPGFAKELRKKRPAVIVSSTKLNSATSYVIVIPATSIVPKVLSKEVVELGEVKGLDKKSILLPLFIRNIDRTRLVKKIGVLSKEKMQEVEKALKLILGMVKE